MWKDFLKNTVLKPGLQRLGTILASLMLFGGDWMCKTFEACGLVTQSGAEMVATYIVAVCLLAFDVIIIHIDRMRAKGKL